MTKAERTYLDRAASLGCALCRFLGLGETPPEIHHERTGTGAALKASNYRVVPLCPNHHRSSNEALHVMGRKAWERHFGVTESQLVEQTRSALAQFIPEGA